MIIPSEEEMVARQVKQSRMDGAGPIPVEAMLELKGIPSNSLDWSCQFSADFERLKLIICKFQQCFQYPTWKQNRSKTFFL